jgi:antiviral helicase SKI2
MQITERVRAVQTRHRADFADEGFNNDLKFGLVEVVYEWAKGMVRHIRACELKEADPLFESISPQPFAQITALTDVQEGTIVRAITRLDETCREVRDAARIVGNSDLFNKMEQCQLVIRRDIVFVASLVSPSLSYGCLKY